MDQVKRQHLETIAFILVTTFDPDVESDLGDEPRSFVADEVFVVDCFGVMASLLAEFDEPLATLQRVIAELQIHAED